MNEKTAGHVANIIKKCYTPQSLAQVAADIGETAVPGEDIFQALMCSGRALDMETAVTLVACHLDEEDTYFEDIPMFLRKDRRSNPPRN